MDQGNLSTITKVQPTLETARRQHYRGPDGGVGAWLPMVAKKGAKASPAFQNLETRRSGLKNFDPDGEYLTLTTTALRRDWSFKVDGRSHRNPKDELTAELCSVF